MERRRAIFVGGVTLLAVAAVGILVQATFTSPSAPTHFDAAGFADFDAWDCAVEEWAAINPKSADLRDRMIYCVENASGKLLDVALSRVPSMPQPRSGSTWYRVDRKGERVSDFTSATFTGTVVFREPAGHWLSALMEPTRVELRYYRGNLVESRTTRSDL